MLRDPIANSWLKRERLGMGIMGHWCCLSTDMGVPIDAPALALCPRVMTQHGRNRQRRIALFIVKCRELSLMGEQLGRKKNAGQEDFWLTSMGKQEQLSS